MDCRSLTLWNWWWVNKSSEELIKRTGTTSGKRIKETQIKEVDQGNQRKPVIASYHHPDTGCSLTIPGHRFSWQQMHWIMCWHWTCTEAENSTKKLPVLQPVYNADGTLNAAGRITEFVKVRLTMMDHSKKIQLSVTKLGNPELFLGLDWLRTHNPSID